MYTSSEKWKERVYDLMNGLYDMHQFAGKEARFIESEFEEGKYCQEKYQEVYDASRRLCERLGVDEDDDIEKIIDSLLDMQKYLCCKMYDYGCMFGSAASGRRNKLHRVLSSQ